PLFAYPHRKAQLRYPPRLSEAKSPSSEVPLPLPLPLVTQFIQGDSVTGTPEEVAKSRFAHPNAWRHPAPVRDHVSSFTPSARGSRRVVQLSLAPRVGGTTGRDATAATLASLGHFLPEPSVTSRPLVTAR